MKRDNMDCICPAADPLHTICDNCGVCVYYEDTIEGHDGDYYCEDCSGEYL